MQIEWVRELRECERKTGKRRDREQSHSNIKTKNGIINECDNYAMKFFNAFESLEAVLLLSTGAGKHCERQSEGM